MSTDTKKESSKTEVDDKGNKDKKKTDLGLLEEDDEFEEFPAEGELEFGFNRFYGN